MLLVLQKFNCGFTGCAVIGLSYRNDGREYQKDIGFWEHAVTLNAIFQVACTITGDEKVWGCGVLLSGVCHQELETTVPDRKINAPEYLEI